MIFTPVINVTKEITNHLPVGGVAQWLERRSLTGEFSLIYG